jgi:hypothetical protein
MSSPRRQERDLLLFVFNEKQPAAAGFAEFTLDGSTLLTVPDASTLLGVPEQGSEGAESNGAQRRAPHDRCPFFISVRETRHYTTQMHRNS